jgi:subfamily B ATP-binding cassette protein MsbA
MSSPQPLPPLVVYKRLLRYTLPHWKVFAIGMIGMAILAGVDVGFTALTKPLLDQTFLKRDPLFIRLMPFAIVGLFVLRGASSFMSAYGMAFVGRRVIKDLRDDLFRHLLRLPARFYDRNSSGQLIARLTYHVEQVAEAVTSALTSVIKDGLTIVGLIGMMLYLNWRLAAFALIVGPFIALIIRYVSRRFRRISQRIQDSVGDVTAAAEEAVSAQRVIKIHNGQDYEAARFDALNDQNRKLMMKIVATQSGSAALIQFIAAWAVAAIVYYATQPDMLAVITPGTFAAFMLAMLSLLSPMKSLGQINEKVQRGISAAGDVFRLMDEEVEPAGGTYTTTRARGHIEYRDVRVRYSPDQAEALRGVSVEIKPGQTVAFVGKSGSGKSTLLSLLPRFYEATAGSIRLDGVELRDYEIGNLRRQVALVDQQVRLFNGTVGENIAYGLSPPPSREKIIEAAKLGYAWEFIEKLPLQLDEPIGQNGGRLSGGQRQRLAIARALLKDAPILMLDEATSALDTESERYIQAGLEKLVAGRTTLVIAHRLSTVQRADVIVVMQDGRIVESGRHAELLARNGVYAALHRMQFEDDDVVESVA